MGIQLQNKQNLHGNKIFWFFFDFVKNSLNERDV